MTRSTIRLTGGRLALPDGPRTGDLVLRDGRIDAIRTDAVDELPVRSADADDSSAVTVDVSGLLVAPGFVDLQVNGGHGIDLTSELGERPDRLWELAARLPAQGVTAFVPTIVSSSSEAVAAALTALARRPADHVGATALGVHAEGPMLAPAKRGTHAPEALRPPDPSLIEGWSRDAGLVLVTVAPELPGACGIIAELVRRDVVVALGHTDATFEEATAGLEAGARAGTHLGNAMSGFTARQPGAIGALLADPDAVVGLIVDGVHLHPGTVAALWRLLGPRRIALVTDAIAAAGTDGGEAVLGGRTVTIADGVVRDEDGALAGSTVTMDRALRELVAATGADPFAALRAATATPAGLLGERRRGVLAVGGHGDVVVLTSDLEVVATFVAGRLAAHPRPDRLPLPPELGGASSVGEEPGR
ncbi:N-acetylglucosamine-6-phosphate deacetylase [Egicoccus sp. AB-alg6-2]|uniref:N-acetylglucosamine-6-phosphate deacetylase n=1 Tax=Egicoccus sp. AB-alg6-2 TaxID=3242692 RepID=UPI00359D6D2B